MNIYEALDQLERMYDNNADMMCEEDIEACCEAFEVIYDFIRKYEPHPEDLPMTFQCMCGEQLSRCGTLGGMAQFKCSTCEAEWLIGPGEVDE